MGYSVYLDIHILKKKTSNAVISELPYKFRTFCVRPCLGGLWGEGCGTQNGKPSVRSSPYFSGNPHLLLYMSSDSLTRSPWIHFVHVHLQNDTTNILPHFQK